jgi:hypothetical protein
MLRTVSATAERRARYVEVFYYCATTMVLTVAVAPSATSITTM